MKKYAKIIFSSFFTFASLFGILLLSGCEDFARPLRFSAENTLIYDDETGEEKNYSTEEPENLPAEHDVKFDDTFYLTENGGSANEKNLTGSTTSLTTSVNVNKSSSYVLTFPITNTLDCELSKTAFIVPAEKLTVNKLTVAKTILFNSLIAENTEIQKTSEGEYQLVLTLNSSTLSALDLNTNLLSIFSNENIFLITLNLNDKTDDYIADILTITLTIK